MARFLMQSVEKLRFYQSSLVPRLLIEHSFSPGQIFPEPTGLCQQSAALSHPTTDVSAGYAAWCHTIYIHVLPNKLRTGFVFRSTKLQQSTLQKAAATGIAFSTATAADIELESTQAPRTLSHFVAPPPERGFTLFVPPPISTIQ